MVRTLIDATLESSRHSTEWDGRDDRGLSLGSGVYTYRLETGSEIRSERMVLVK